LGAYLEGENYPQEVYSVEFGKMKVPTLRNVDKRPSTGFIKAYGHNGYFKSLADIVHFYRTRSMGMGGGGGKGMGGGGKGMGGMMYPGPEVPANLNPLLSNFCHMDEQKIVEFLKTLSDGYFTRP
jgi:cytochrome c peroxidase